MRAEVGITDDDEKEQARAILVAAGPEGRSARCSEFLDEQESGVAWGLRVLASLAPPEELLGTVLSLLQKLGREYTRDPEKKLVLLSWLREHPDLAGLVPAGGPARDEAIVPLLEDFVRRRAHRRRPRAHRGAAAPTRPARRSSRSSCATGTTPGSAARCSRRSHDLGADVKGHRGDVEALLVEPWYLDREGRVKRRGA